VDSKFEQNDEIKIKFETNDDLEIEEEQEQEQKQEQEQEQEQEQVNPQLDCLIRAQSRRVSRLVQKYVTTHQGHLQTQAIESEEYLIKTAKVIAQTISAMNHQFAQTYSLIKGIKALCNKKCQAVHKEMKQVHNCIIALSSSQY
jgi:hypothetical protein